MRLISLYCVLATIASICMITNGYKILGVFPTMAKSHYIVGSSLMKGLAEKGHEITMISPFPLSKPMKNWRDIPTPGILEKTKALMDNIINLRSQGVIEALVDLFNMGLMLTNLTLQEPSVQNFLRSKEKFDVVVMEIFVNEADIGFGAVFDAPIVGVSTFGSNMWVNDMVGSPAPLSYVPNPFIPLTDRMSLLERLGNIGVSVAERLYNDFVYLPKQKELYEKMIPGDNKPCFYELRKNISMVLLNSHFSVGHPKPYVTNMVEVGGMHINRKTKPLPADIKKFLDEAKDGAIYFSMGSNLKSKLLPVEKREAILKTFAGLKQRVLWKFEDKELPGKPNNVLISDWFPQDDILSHPNVKLFITHGGLLSSMETIYHGVPIIGIPMFGDQFLNMARAERAGFGITVDYEQLSQKTLGDAIREILSNNKYALQIKEMSRRYKDQPMLPLETAIYWVEYVARHKGADHIKSASQALSFIQYHNLDAFGIILLAFYLVYRLIMGMLRKVFGLCFGRTKTEEKKVKVTNKKKKN
ncbi:UDP-glycosyltransferase UGT5-like [Condylostylus longicornis]|uniref:UDP-glycosyltransferase UGT5-like n=1 Tax=Condylostylus longicornis TaxID=2530218 RepID=UPI00244E0812|nr:UDP-glycosyltransferase UGT5-like [Condylostylus longicornis]